MACFDALKGFFHVPLDENSKLLTAMLTPISVFNIADDILVIGETDEEFKNNVIRFLDQCVEKVLHLNADNSS